MTEEHNRIYQKIDVVQDRITKAEKDSLTRDHATDTRIERMAVTVENVVDNMKRQQQESATNTSDITRLVGITDAILADQKHICNSVNKLEGHVKTLTNGQATCQESSETAAAAKDDIETLSAAMAPIKIEHNKRMKEEEQAKQGWRKEGRTLVRMIVFVIFITAVTLLATWLGLEWLLK